MTEKRFHFGYVLGDTGLIDEQAEHKWFIENCCSITDLKKNWKTVCDKLNEVANENEQLKSKNRGLQSELQIFKEDVTHSNLQINKLFDENEQLKQRNTNQYNQLNELWQLIEEENWEKLIAMKKQLKEDEERLQKEWGTYND